MIIKDNLPFSTVEKEGLRKFVQVACPRYKPPSRFKVTGLVERKYSTARIILANILKGTKYLSMSSDIVTATNSTRSLLVVTVHFLNASGSDCDVYLCSCCLIAQNMTESCSKSFPLIFRKGYLLPLSVTLRNYSKINPEIKHWTSS